MQSVKKKYFFLKRKNVIFIQPSLSIKQPKNKTICSLASLKEKQFPHSDKFNKQGKICGFNSKTNLNRWQFYIRFNFNRHTLK